MAGWGEQRGPDLTPVTGCLGCHTPAGRRACTVHGTVPPSVVAVRCRDCKVLCSAATAFAVIPPEHRSEGDGKPFWLCITCWDGIVGAAFMQAIR